MTVSTKTWTLQLITLPSPVRPHYLEECDEGVGGGGPAENESQEGGETSIEDCRTDLLQARDGPLQPTAAAHYEAVPDMNAVVHAETNRDDDVDAGHDIDGDVPEVEVAHDVNQGDGDHQHNHEADLDVGQEEKGDDEDAAETKADISPELVVDDGVRLPGEVDLVEGDGVREVGVRQDGLYGGPGRRVRDYQHNNSPRLPLPIALYSNLVNDDILSI